MTYSDTPRTSDPVVTPYLRDWHNRKYPTSVLSKWPEIKRRAVLPEPAPAPEIAPTPEPEPEQIIDWNLIRPVSTRRPEQRIPVARIISLCAKAGQIKIADLIGPRRSRDICVPRQCAAYLAATYCRHMSLPSIGMKLGGRDHSTVMHARDRVRADLAAGGARFNSIVAYVEMQLGLR